MIKETYELRLQQAENVSEKDTLALLKKTGNNSYNIIGVISGKKAETLMSLILEVMTPNKGE